jgi:SpoVK/Ycf46/Vps4 family AAA+-type ATPase
MQKVLSDSKGINAQKKYVKFSFEMVDLGPVREQLMESNAVNLVAEAYEKHKFLECVYKALSWELKDKKDTSVCRSLFCGEWGAAIAFTDFYPIFQNIKTKTEKQIGETPEVLKLLNDWANTRPTEEPTISTNFLQRNSGVKEILRAASVKVLEEIKAYLEQKDTKKLKKTYYTINLEWFFKLYNILDEDVCNLTRFLFYRDNFMIFRRFLPDSLELPYIRKYAGISELKLSKIIRGPLKKAMFICPTRQDSCFSTYGSFALAPAVSSSLLLKYKNYAAFANDRVVRVENTGLTIEDFDHVSDSNGIFNIIQNALKNKTKGINILLYGKAGTGKTALAKTIINKVTPNGYVVSSNATGAGNWARQENFSMLKYFLSGSADAVILYDEAEDYFRKKDDVEKAKYDVNQELEENTTPVIWTANSLFFFESSFIRRFTCVVNVKELTGKALNNLVNSLCKKHHTEISDRCRRLIEKSHPSVGVIETALLAGKMCKVKGSDIVYNQIKEKLELMSGKIVDIPPSTNHCDYDLSLANTDVSLTAVADGIEKSGKNNWSMILYGVSGTGKTAFADYLSKRLNMPIIKKKISDLQSPFVGQTEKNISEAFDEAKRENAILVLDEADIWLMDRNKAYRSWEISQTNQMLQEMDVATTPVIVTTNIFKSMDQAVLRRFVFKIGFKYMTPKQVKQAFKTFYGLSVSSEDSNISYAAPGDFVVVKKQLEFLGKPDDVKTVKNAILDEIKNKKDDFKDASIGF